MGVKLNKKQTVSLQKNTKFALLGLGWDANRKGGYNLDLDLTLFLVNANGVCEEAEDMIFYNNYDGPNGCVHHTGDDRTGDSSSDGDDEQIQIDFDKVPDRIEAMYAVVTIDRAEARRQVFKDANRAYVRVCKTEKFNATEGDEEVMYDMTKEFTYSTGMVAAKIYRNGRGWAFEALGEEFDGGLYTMCKRFGIEVDD